MVNHTCALQWWRIVECTLTFGSSLPVSYTHLDVYKRQVFEFPKEGATYSCGVDTAHGLGKEDEDRFCASMTRVSTGSGCDIQAAELTSLRFSPAQAVPFLAAMAAWYGQVSKHYSCLLYTSRCV